MFIFRYEKLAEQVLMFNTNKTNNNTARETQKDDIIGKCIVINFFDIIF